MTDRLDEIRKRQEDFAANGVRPSLVYGTVNRMFDDIAYLLAEVERWRYIAQGQADDFSYLLEQQREQS